MQTLCLHKVIGRSGICGADEETVAFHWAPAQSLWNDVGSEAFREDRSFGPGGHQKGAEWGR